MKELMIHVEQIVRPVRAFQSLKLRMRRELMNHLQAAMDEEQSRGVDTSQALEAAKHRLGDPNEIRQSLQDSVPLHQRLLLMRLPAPTAIDRLENSTNKRLRFLRHLTLMHAAVLMGSVAVLSILVLGLSAKPLIVDRSALAGDAPFNVRIYILLAWILANALTVAGCGFVAIASAQRKQFRRRAAGFAIAIICTQLLWTFLISKTFGAGRVISARDWLTSAALGLGMVIVMTLLARLLGRLREPYDQWLTLEIEQ